MCVREKVIDHFLSAIIFLCLQEAYEMLGKTVCIPTILADGTNQFSWWNEQPHNLLIESFGDLKFLMSLDSSLPAFNKRSSKAS